MLADIIMSLVMYAVSGIMIWQMGKIPDADSRIFPTAIVVILIGLGTVLLLITLLKKEKTNCNFSNTLRGMKLFGILLAFALCTKWFGFYSCVPFFLLAAMLFLGQRNKVTLAVVTVAMTVVVILLFDVLFKVRIPEGTLFDPYALIF